MGICEFIQKENIKERAEFNLSVCLGHCLNLCLNISQMKTVRRNMEAMKKKLHESFIVQKNATLHAIR